MQQNHVTSSYTPKFSFWLMLKFKSQLKIFEATMFTSLLKESSRNKIYHFIRRSVLAVFLKQTSYNLLKKLCATLFFKRNWYSDTYCVGILLWIFRRAVGACISWNGTKLVSPLQFLLLSYMHYAAPTPPSFIYENQKQNKSS